jgi:hypothetical protein
MSIHDYQQDFFLAANECKRVSVENDNLLSALMSMCWQYLSDDDEKTFTHDFMSAGEETLGLMVTLGYMVEFKRGHFKRTDKAFPWQNVANP